LSRRRRVVLAAVAALLLLLVFDLSRAPGRQATAAVLLWGIDLYQATLSPGLSRAGVRCRFTPSCSRYGEEVIRRDGALMGGLRAGWRILRCGPWSEPGTHDSP
jgi:uncharacterized protein